MSKFIFKNFIFNKRKNILFFIFFIISAFAAYNSLQKQKNFSISKSTEITGSAYVIDGDSIVVKSRKLRLKGIDALELHQDCTKKKRKYPCGKMAKKHLISLVKNKTISCFFDQFDQYNRALATCYSQKININRQMVLEGFAVSYNDYPSEEKEAKSQKRGVWSYKFISPYKWRKLHPYKPK